MRIRLESAKRIGRRIGLNDDNGYLVAILLALIIVSSIIAGYYLVLRPQPEAYNTIYLLDANNKAVDYPEVLVVNQSGTFSVKVMVENHMGGAEKQTYQVQVKVTEYISTFPIDRQPIEIYDFTLKDGDNWSHSATMTQKEVGSYSVVFELWRLGDSGSYEFTHNYCVLNIEVTTN
jgi:uncharacterized membrane protein